MVKNVGLNRVNIRFYHFNEGVQVINNSPKWYDCDILQGGKTSIQSFLLQSLGRSTVVSWQE